MSQKKLRKQIIRTAQNFNATALSMGTSGNVSARTKGGFLITPTGIAYDEMHEGDIVFVDFEGSAVPSHATPSSEWRFHRDIYQSRPEINAVVHVHSHYATAIACTRQEIPAFHYEVALAGGHSILCAEYATFGTQALSDNIAIALKDRTACLIANHGQVTLGESIKQAFTLSQSVEGLAKQYTLSKQLGGPILLSEEEMNINIEKFKHYGARGQ